MEGFELAGRTVWIFLFFFLASNTQIRRQLRVNTVHEKGTAKYTQQDSLDEAGGDSSLLLYPFAITHPYF